jgi:hypothetical protein
VRRARARSLPKKHLRNQKSDKKELLLGIGAAVRLVSRARVRVDIPILASTELHRRLMRSQPESLTQDVLAGLIERVTYHNAENGFCVLRTQARGHRDVVTVVGYAAAVSAGEWITAFGEWVNDRTTGSSFGRVSCAPRRQRRPTASKNIFPPG